MKLNTPQNNSLTIDGIKYNLLGEDGATRFSAPASTKGIPKLYALYDNNVLHYIGITSQSVASRLKSGLKAIGKNGYHGYKWKHIAELYLTVWTLDGCGATETYKTLETIEAEAVFLYRKHHKRWPESQHEIHFHNNENISEDLPKIIIDHINKRLN